MCELCLDSREGTPARGPEAATLRSPRRRGEGSLQEDQSATSLAPEAVGRKRAKPSRLRLAEPAHACVARVRARHAVIFILVLLEHAAASDAAHDRSEPSSSQPGNTSLASARTFVDVRTYFPPVENIFKKFGDRYVYF